MKTLKFKPHLADMILAGEKMTTWRLFDDKDLQEGDELQLLHSETKEVFGEAKIDSIVTKKLKDLTNSDWEGHEKFSTKDEMYKTYNLYYKEAVTPDTEVKIIKFSLTK